MAKNNNTERDRDAKMCIRDRYGIEHARHAARRNQLVQLRASGRDRRRAEAAHQHALEPRHEIQPCMAVTPMV